MQKKSIDFLQELVEAPSPSGFEQPAQEVVRKTMKQYVDEVNTDVHGNVIGVKNPKGKLRIMLAGHCDEIGFMVNYIDDNGYIRFSSIGGVDANLVPGQRVYIHSRKGPVLGVIGKKPIHLMEHEDRKKGAELHKLWIDVGAKDKKEAEKLVEVGDPATFTVGFERLRNNLVVSRAFDDKIGSFIVVETMRLLANKKINVAVYGVSTVQEEIGLRGARTSAYGIDPHAGIAIDVGHASDCPDVDKTKVGEVSLGKGPILHKGANINPVLGKMLIDAAKKKKIPYQLTAEPRGTGTDANAIQISRSGVAAALVSVPNRYMHTPVEVVSLEDLESSAKLLAELLAQMGDDIDLTP